MPSPSDRFPWMSRTPEQREAERRERHKRWLSSLTDRDWARLSALADQVTPGFCPARIEDLDAPGIAVGVCLSGREGYTSGERIGSLRGGAVAVLVWVKG